MGLVVAAMSSLVSVSFWSYVGIIAGIYCILAFSLDIQYSEAGIMNFGQVGFMAISGYTMAILVVRLGLNIWLSAFCGIILAGVFGVIMALPSFRLKADYFAITTIAIGYIVEYLAKDLNGLTGGSAGTTNMLGPSQAASYDQGWEAFVNRVDSLFAKGLGSGVGVNVATMVIVWLVVLLIGIGVWRLMKTPWARGIRTLRDDEAAAMSLGKNVFLLRIEVMAIGGVIGGVAGVLFAFQAVTISPTDFDPLVTFFIWTIIILGGLAKRVGIIVGSVVFGFIYAGVLFFTFTPFSLLKSYERDYLQLMIVGLVLILLVRFRPEGIFGDRRLMELS